MEKTKQFRELNALTVTRSRHLRTYMTDAEKKLWHHLKRRQLNGHKFRRQHPVDTYIVDFICIEQKLIIELDGGQHSLQQGYDTKRSTELKCKGYIVLRFWNDEVIKNMESVLETIMQNVQAPLPASPFQGEE